MGGKYKKYELIVLLSVWLWIFKSGDPKLVSVLMNIYWFQRKTLGIAVPGSAKSRIYAGKITKSGFSKKVLTGTEKLFLF